MDKCDRDAPRSGKEHMTEQEVYNQLAPLIHEVTGVGADQVTMESGLVSDLGAESVDLLDLSFLIEEHFNITIEADEFERQAGKRLGGTPFERDGLLTAEALEELKRALPEVPANRLTPGLKKSGLSGILTVGAFVHLIQRKLNEEQQESDRVEE